MISQNIYDGRYNEMHMSGEINNVICVSQNAMEFMAAMGLVQHCINN